MKEEEEVEDDVELEVKGDVDFHQVTDSIRLPVGFQL